MERHQQHLTENGDYQLDASSPSRSGIRSSHDAHASEHDSLTSPTRRNRIDQNKYMSTKSAQKGGKKDKAHMRHQS